jgi:hypothetical protein
MIHQRMDTAQIHANVIGIREDMQMFMPKFDTVTICILKYQYMLIYLYRPSMIR